jgi:hypothetical protein
MDKSPNSFPNFDGVGLKASFGMTRSPALSCCSMCEGLILVNNAGNLILLWTEIQDF